MTMISLTSRNSTNFRKLKQLSIQMFNLTFSNKNINMDQNEKLMAIIKMKNNTININKNYKTAMKKMSIHNLNFIFLLTPNIFNGYLYYSSIPPFSLS